MSNEITIPKKELQTFTITGDFFGTGENKTFQFALGKPSLNQKKAVWELMEKYGLSYGEYQKLQSEFLKHQDNLTNVDEDSMTFYLKVQDIEATTEFLPELFAIWASRNGQGYSQKAETEKKVLAEYFADFGGEVTLSAFFAATH